MKFVLIGPTYPFRGGIAHHTTHLYDALSIRHSVEFVAFRRQYPRWLFPGHSDKDPGAAPAQAIALPLLDSLNPITWIQTAMYAREKGPNALILPWWIPFWSLPFATISYWVKRSGARVIFVCHNLASHEPFPGGAWLTRIALRQGKGFVVQSADDEQRIRKIMPGAHVKYVPHPIYAPRHRAPQTNRTRNDNAAQLLFFGFVRPYKGLPILIEALPRVLENKAVHLTVAGEFWEDRQGYARRIAELGIERAVTLIDRYIPDEELDELFARTDLAILPYISVTTSAALGRAIGGGVPVVVSEVGDLGSIVRENSIGCAATSGDPSALADAILECLEPAKLECYHKNVQTMRESAEQTWARLVTAIEELAST